MSLFKEFIPGKGGLRKIRDIKPPCRHPQHNPPGYIVLSPGVYEHVCPGCGKSITFTVPYVGL